MSQFNIFCENGKKVLIYVYDGKFNFDSDNDSDLSGFGPSDIDFRSSDSRPTTTIALPMLASQIGQLSATAYITYILRQP